MIAKLCTWAPTRTEAIEGMRLALDTFEVEGIGHNLPFLGAVMDHPRFASGDITTAFIAEEYPDGFQGVTLPEAALRRVAAAAAAMNRVAEIRRTRISGRLGQPRAQGRRRLGGQPAGDRDRGQHRRRPRRRHRALRRWHGASASPVTGRRASRSRGSTSMARPLVLKIGKIPSGFRIRTARRRSQGSCPHPAPGRTCPADAGKGRRPTPRDTCCVRCRAWS